MNKYKIKYNTLPRNYSSWCEENMTHYDIDDNITFNLLEAVSYSLKEGVTEIGRAAFYKSYMDTIDYLVEIELPEYITKIDDFAFHGGNKLTILNLPKNITSIGEKAFFDCGFGCDLHLVNVNSVKKGAFEDVRLKDNTKILFEGNDLLVGNESLKFIGNNLDIEISGTIFSLYREIFGSQTNISKLSISSDILTSYELNLGDGQSIPEIYAIPFSITSTNKLISILSKYNPLEVINMIQVPEDNTVTIRFAADEEMFYPITTTDAVFTSELNADGKSKSLTEKLNEILITELTKQDILVSRSNIKEINGQSLLGSGNIEIEAPHIQLRWAVEPHDNFYIGVSDWNYNEETGEWTASIHVDGLVRELEHINSYITSIREEVTESLDSKQDLLESGTNIKKINGQSILGKGEITTLKSIPTTLTSNIKLIL